MTIEQVLENNKFKLSALFRRYGMGAKPLTVDSIRAGYEKNGEPFMLKVLEILVPDNSSFEGLIKPISATVSAPGSAIDTKVLMPMTPADKSKTWGFFEKLLNGVGSLGETIGQFKRDVTSDPAGIEYTATQEAAAKRQTNIIYMVAGGLLLLILIILLIRK